MLYGRTLSLPVVWTEPYRPLQYTPMGFERELVYRPALVVELVAVVARGHQLATRGPLSADDLKPYVNLVLSEQLNAQEASVVGGERQRRWFVGDSARRTELVRAGLGWARLPRHLIEDEVENGRLVTLELRDKPSWRIPLFVIHGVDHQPGPAAAWLVDDLVEADS